MERSAFLISPAPLTKYTKRFTQFAAWWLAWAALNFHYVTTAFGYRTQNNLFIPKMLLFSLNLFIFKFSFGYTTKIIDSDSKEDKKIDTELSSIKIKNYDFNIN